MSEMDTRIAGAPLGPGTRLNGIFEIDGRIASGGMGEIYRGHATETGDPVAIKVMRTDLDDNAVALALFRKEAAALRDIYHEAIVRYYLFTHDPATQRHYLAMEFVDGEPLSSLLKRGPLSFDAVCKLQQRLAAGLEAAHSHDIIHRDLTPDNVLVPGGDVGRAKIIDFGIARIMRAGEGTIIGTGFAGKYNYVSPEQLGLFGGKVTAKSDIYSLGLVLAQCLIGQALDMGGSEFGVMAIDRRRSVPDLGAVDPRYRPLLTRMLQPDPADRPNSMAEIAEWRPQVEPLPARPTLATRPGSRREPGGRTRGDVNQARKFPLRTAALGTLALVIGLGVAALYLIPSSGPIPEPSNGPKLNPGPSTLPPRDPEKAEDIKQRQVAEFINSYNGGNCFYVTPPQIEEKKAVVDGYGTPEDLFDTLVKNFERKFDLELEIGLYRVVPKQCPAVNYLWLMRSQRLPIPQLTTSSGTLSSGSELTGRIVGVGNRNVYLLLVADNGEVWNVTDRLRPNGDTKNFAFGLERYPHTEPPQLLIAVISDRPIETIEALMPPQVGTAETLFSRLLAETAAARQSVNVTFKYFSLK